MNRDECDFKHEGLCIVAEEFPEMKDSPCQHNKNGFCTAKPEDLTSFCPDCGEEHCYGDCLDTDETRIGPKKTHTLSGK